MVCAGVRACVWCVQVCVSVCRCNNVCVVRVFALVHVCMSVCVCLTLHVTATCDHVEEDVLECACGMCKCVRGVCRCAWCVQMSIVRVCALV